jgi:glycosyltransferase involved in cell wall biosynthesis
MKVALVKPPVAGHGARGVGFYGQRLFESLKESIDVSWVNFSYIPTFGFDLVHFPYFDLFWPTLPPIRSGKTVVTLHDLTPLKFPQHFPLGFRAKIVWPWQKFLLKNVDAVLTDSQCSQKDIEEMVGLKNVQVTYLAADSVFRPLGLKRENYVLYVGGGNWNKNVITLVRACRKINVPLVLVGREFLQKPVENIETLSLREVQKEIDGKTIIAKGFVETQDLVKLYNQARVYVQPSTYEGFGLPVLEAMACGAPVVCGKNSSLAEIAGEAATYANVTDDSDLATAIKRVKASGKEISQAGKFSWKKTAQETIKVYEKVLAGI